MPFIVCRKPRKSETLNLKTVEEGEAPALDICLIIVISKQPYKHCELSHSQAILQPRAQDGCFTTQQQKPGAELAQASLPPALPPSLPPSLDLLRDDGSICAAACRCSASARKEEGVRVGRSSESPRFYPAFLESLVSPGVGIR